MIKLEHVSKAYSAGIPALNDVSLHIKGRVCVRSRREWFR